MHGISPGQVSMDVGTNGPVACSAVTISEKDNHPRLYTFDNAAEYAGGHFQPSGKFILLLLRE